MNTILQEDKHQVGLGPSGRSLSGSFLDGRFFDQHHRNVIDDRIDSLALLAFQAFAVLGQMDALDTDRAGKDIQQFLTDSHFASRSIGCYSTILRQEKPLRH